MIKIYNKSLESVKFTINTCRINNKRTYNVQYITENLTPPVKIQITSTVKFTVNYWQQNYQFFIVKITVNFLQCNLVDACIMRDDKANT